MADHDAAQSRKTIYLAGKITGDPDYKAKFQRAAEMVEQRMGCIVLSPAILPAEGFSYGAYRRMSEAMLRECDMICMLPGWQDSVGAIEEMGVADELGMMVILLPQELLEGCGDAQRAGE